MSRFFSSNFDTLTPYVPGEQPRDTVYTKLNTNENPFPPSEKAKAYAREHLRELNLYSDPECTELREKLAELCGVTPQMIIPCNGSDEILYFAFMAFCDDDHPVAFPDISYGFYSVFAEVNLLPYTEIPLNENLEIVPEDYIGIGKMVVIANPNAPTGRALPLSDIERIVAGNPDNVVIIDEAYVDFGGESAVSLVKKYDNLLVVRTFSKSRSMAGARLGFAVGCESLIADLNTIRYSTNPYNINSMTQAMGLGVLNDEETTQKNCRTVMEVREYATEELRKLGFTVIPSCANFVFAATEKMDGGDLYRALKEKGVLVRHFDKDRISNYNRITIGTREQMDLLLEKLREILGVEP